VTVAVRTGSPSTSRLRRLPAPPGVTDADLVQHGAGRRPDLVACLFLLGATARPGRGLELGPEALATYGCDWDDQEQALGALARSMGDHDDCDLRWLRETFAERSLPMTTRSIQRHGLAAMRSAAPTDDELGAVACPVLVIAGDEDRSLPPENGRVIAADMPHARFELVGGMGHWPGPRHVAQVVKLIAVEIRSARILSARAGTVDMTGT